MCARLGIRQAYSQAYRPQANGRAEVAGKSIISLLRKVNTQGHTNWVEALPRVMWAYHNRPGETGLSPFQIVFGRDRFEAGASYPPLRECEDAFNFFERMAKIDEFVASSLNQLHESQQRRANANRAVPPD